MNSTTPQMSRGPRNDRRNWASEPLRDQNGDPRMMNVMKMIGAFTNCLKASHEGLKALTPIPNPIRKSPQKQVT